MTIARQWFVHRRSSTALHRQCRHPTKHFHRKDKMHQVHPPEGFFNKSVRYANQAVGLLGTAKGVLEAGRYVYGGLQAARPLLAMI